MNATVAQQIETNVERGASAAFAGAVGFAVYGAFGEAPLQPELGLGMAVTAMIAYSICRTALEAAGQRPFSFKVPHFEVPDIEVDDELLLTPDDRVGGAELVLTDEQRVGGSELTLDPANAVQYADQPLELDDILQELQPDSRVVRLFDRTAMPTPGQLSSRIDRHLGDAHDRPLSDASQALSDALAELRRSLR